MSLNLVHARAIAPAAQAWLGATRAARVLNVFDRALNLVNQHNAVLSLVTHERGMTPFGLALAAGLAAPFEGLTADSPVTLAPDGLTIGSLRVIVTDAALWNPQPDWDVIRATLSTEPVRLKELAVLCLPIGRGVSPSSVSPTPNPFNPLPNLLPPAASLLNLYADPAASALPPALFNRFLSGASDLVAGLRLNDEALAQQGARGLAGLGGGLTPAGDDFAVGVCLAAWAGLYPETARGQCTRLVETMAPLTTTLSAAYLRAAAQGECSAHWHALFDALTEATAAARHAALSHSVAALFALGHTSGADGLAGFLAYNQFPHRRHA